MSGTKRLASFFIFKHVIQNCQLLRVHSSSESEWTNESINQWSTLSIGKIMTDKTKCTWGRGDPTHLALSTTNLKCNSLGQTRPLSDRLVPNHVTNGTEVWALMSPLNFYCIPPPSTAVMLHSRHSKHCNTVPVQSQHTAHSVKCGYWIWTHYEIVRLFSWRPDITFWAAWIICCCLYIKGLWWKKNQCVRKCANTGVITETYNISAAVAGTSYTAVVTIVTIIAIDLHTAVATMCGNILLPTCIQLWLPLSQS
jgi:hypothetical protein